MPKPLTPKIINIIHTFRLRIGFTFGTRNNINLGLGGLTLMLVKGFDWATLSLLKFSFHDDEEHEL